MEKEEKEKKVLRPIKGVEPLLWTIGFVIATAVGAEHF